MSVRLAAALAALLGVLALPAGAAANPTMQVDVVSSTNLSRLPAFVAHRLTFTAGAQDETVRVEAIGSGLEVGGSGQVTESATVPGEGTMTCTGQWMAFHRIQADRFVSGFRIPAGTTATVTVPVRFTSAPFADDTLDGQFSVQFGDQKPFTVVSEAPRWTGPITPQMSLFVLRGANRTTVLTGQADGVTSGLVEVWGISPRAKQGRKLKTIRVDDDGRWSWAGWRPHVRGGWELYARYRRTATSARTGATECGVTFVVG